MAFARRWSVIVGVLAWAIAGAVRADIYSYVDGHGVRHITNQPQGDSRYQRVMKTPQYQTPGQKKPAHSAPAALSAVPSVNGWQMITPTGRWRLVTGNGWQQIRPSDRMMTLKSATTGKALPFNLNSDDRRRYTAVVAQIARRNGVDPKLVDAVISAESAYNPDAVSSAGAMGLMQLMPATARRFGVSDPFDPTANIRGGVRYLHWLLDKFNNNVVLALAGYNAGENAVINHDYTVPPYAETRTYVTRVLQFYQRYRHGVDLSFNN